MKRFVSLILAVLMLVMFCACGKEPQTSNSSYTQIGNENSSQAVSSSSDTTSSDASDVSSDASSDVSSDVLSDVSSDTSSDTSSSDESSAETSDVSSSTSSQGSSYSDNPAIPNLYRPSTGAGYGYVQESGYASASYFDDAVFVGDSVSLKLSYYCASTAALGNASFLTSGSLGSGNALWDISDESVHPSYQGVKTKIEDAIADMGAKKVYIMLGMNDIGLYGIEDTLVNYQTLISLILQQSPDAQIYIQSMTPMLATSNVMGSGLNNDKIAEYNERLLDLCEANNWYFVDVASVMYAEDGFLKYEYCSDPDSMGIHFTSAGCVAWVDYLFTHTAQ